MNLPLFITLMTTWNYLLFVQYWPGCWIQNGHIHATNFTNDHFNVHGIWPEYYNGSYPQYCNKTATFDINQLTPIYNNLTTYWTDYINATAFWQHEFLRHGTCAEADPVMSTELEFFSTGLQLREKYNLYQILANHNILPSNTKSYALDDIRAAVTNGIQKQVAVTCQNNILDEIIICLDVNLNAIDCPSNIPQCGSANISYNSVQKIEFSNDYLLH